MRNFKFTIFGEDHEFVSEDKCSHVSATISDMFPDCILHEDYCMCYDACDCENGHYITSSKWVADDPLKPWVGKTISDQVPLMVWVTEIHKKRRTEKWSHYYNNPMW